MELALMADIRVASVNARFGELFVKRGLWCDAAGLGRLGRLVGRVVDADEAAGPASSRASWLTTRCCPGQLERGDYREVVAAFLEKREPRFQAAERPSLAERARQDRSRGDCGAQVR